MNINNAGGPVLAFPDSMGAATDEELGPRHNPEWVAYCRTREAQERAAAKKAHSLEARRVHQELAQGYARFAAGSKA
ncbi:MAG: hypothetical protein QOF34_1232 [Sphingomonadales bacterium]|nr:hypothetical protein [Sphingomonadales bacterium]